MLPSELPQKSSFGYILEEKSCFFISIQNSYNAKVPSLLKIIIFKKSTVIFIILGQCIKILETNKNK